MNPTHGITVPGVKGMILLLALALVSCAPAPATRTSTEIPQATKQQVLVAYGKLPLSFEANQGQTDPQVKFLARGRGYTLFLSPDEAVFVLRKAKAEAQGENSSPLMRNTSRLMAERVGDYEQTILRMKLAGANPAPEVVGVGELPGKSNYFVGNDPKKWRANLPTYAKVEYRRIYPGVNLVYYGNQRQLEHDFVVSPGADPKAITLAFEGMDGVAIDALGDLVLRAAGSEVRLRQPVVYQEQNGQRAVIPTRYVLKAERQVSFEVAAYDATKQLIIDPVLAYSTYLGGSNSDGGSGIAVDAAGNAYVTGNANSTNFPTTTGAFRNGLVGFADAFVTKLDPTGSTLLYSTYLGGSNFNDATGIAVDAAGNVYVTGSTLSNDFPTTVGASQPTSGGDFDAFVTKLNPTGSALVYSTFLGGSSFDASSAIAVDASGNAYVTGSTLSIDFPTTAGAFQTTFGGFVDAFVTKLNPTGSAVIYSTYLGGNNGDGSSGIAVDSADNAFVTGGTNSTNFPTTAGAFQTTFGGSVFNAFVTKLSSTGSTLLYSTYLGSRDFNQATGIAVDAAGNAYVTGETDSFAFPTTVGAFQTTFAGTADAFVTKFNPTGSAIVYSTYVGGSDEDRGVGIAVDAAGNAYMTGFTFSPNFPTTANASQTTLGGGSGVGDRDAFVAKLDPTGAALVYSTYLGGTGDDLGFGIAVDAAGNAYVTGETGSFNFPTTAGAFQPTFGGPPSPFVTNAFVAKLSFGNTQPGTGVKVELGQVTVTFDNVASAGDTTLATSTAGPSPPAGFKLGNPPTYYELTTTASSSGSVTVCIDYNTITFNKVASLKL